ncbi:MAG: LLM class F420-dependent oxidoreductase [Candidatus Limnocylindrales bacterium]
MTRPFRFGVVFTGLTDAAQWPDLARRVEHAGFSTLLVADHYTNPMACTPLLMAAASATTTLRIGSYVYNNDFRHPALLAKEAATIDVLSGGRLELGVGAGWFKTEYDRAGLPFDPPGARASRFEEAVELIARLLRGGPVTHEGTHYRLDGLDGSPHPIQQPIPLLIGGGGPRILRLAARVANIVAFVPRSLAGGGLDPADFAVGPMDGKIQRLESAVVEAARSDGGPERSVLLFGLIDRSGAASDARLPPELSASSPYALVGDPGAMVELMHERRERWGLTYYVCFARDLERFAPVVERALAAEVR